MHELLIEKAAERDIRALEPSVQKLVLKALGNPAAEPRPSGCAKISGSRADWRIRAGDYRILYEVNDRSRTVRIFRVRHRREVYR